MKFIKAKDILFKLEKCYIFLILVVVATFISAYCSLDSIAYQNIFNQFKSSSIDDILKGVNNYGIFFLFLSRIFDYFDSIFWFSVISVISIGLKFLLIEKGSRHFYLSLIVYLACFFVLFDGTVIRASLAIIIAYWGGYYFSQSRYFLALILVFLAASCFHYSLAFFFLIVFFNSRKTAFILIVSYPILLILWWFGISFLNLTRDWVVDLSSHMLGIAQLRYYLLQIDPNALPYSISFFVLFISSVLVWWRYRNELTNFERLCFNCVFTSLVVLVVFVGATATQNRISEIFRFGLIFIFPLYYRYLLEWVRKPYLASALVAIVLIAYFYKFVILQGLIRFS